MSNTKVMVLLVMALVMGLVLGGVMNAVAGDRIVDPAKCGLENCQIPGGECGGPGAGVACPRSGAGVGYTPAPVAAPAGGCPCGA